MTTLPFSTMNLIGKAGVKDIEKYLLSLPETHSILNVEGHPVYRNKDIDLIQILKLGKPIKIEVKTDTQHITGNYFFETISNNNTKSCGCFLYTEADFIYYYFIGIKELHILPLPEIRDWFIINQGRFFLKSAGLTPAGMGEYNSLGRCVPRNIALKENQNIKVVNL